MCEVKIMYRLRSRVTTWHYGGRRVFVRADLNVPRGQGGKIFDFKLHRACTTIDAILGRGGRIVLASHRGRPVAQEPALSMRNLVPWFSHNGYRVAFAKTCDEARARASEPFVLLENLRFFQGELMADDNFARELASLGDFYVNDAFAALHRADTSLTLVPTYFDPRARGIGLLVEDEVHELNKLVCDAPRPFVLIVGGSKVHDKAQRIEHMLDKVDVLLVVPAFACACAAASGGRVGMSHIDARDIEACATLLEKAQRANVPVRVPLDYQVARGTLEGQLSITRTGVIEPGDVGVSIGPRTARAYASEIHQAGTVFYNGLAGFLERYETLAGARAILQAMAHAHQARTIIGGGQTVAAAELCGFSRAMTFCSTGGGATLTYLAHMPFASLEVLDPEIF